MKSTAEIQADFDRIARAETPGGWNHNNHYHDFLLRHMPAHCASALDVGCGAGDFARLLAQHADHVLGIDLSAEMLRRAREQSAAFPNVEYRQADVMTDALPPAAYDCIASIATLHHMALGEVLPRLKAALKPGGVLLVLDLFNARSIGDYLVGAAAMPVNLIMTRMHGGHPPASLESQAAWQAHGDGDVYPTLAEVRRACAELLPGARVTRHLLWRYSLVWRKG